jgi:hypothetical protein
LQRDNPTLCHLPQKDTLVHHDEHHDDFGGLHRDFLQTGTTMDRRNALRFATMLGMGLGALQLLGGSSIPATDTLET